MHSEIGLRDDSKNGETHYLNNKMIIVPMRQSNNANRNEARLSEMGVASLSKLAAVVGPERRDGRKVL